MSAAAIVSRLTVTEFVEDGEAFHKWMEEQFAGLDLDGDGFLSQAELMREFKNWEDVGGDGECVEEKDGDQDGLLFEMFDTDGSGSVDLEEFEVAMRKIMLTMAHGIGDSPVHMALDSNSCLLRAVEHELARQG